MTNSTGAALQITKPKRELNASLLRAALSNRVAKVRAVLAAGADVHAAKDDALRSAVSLGYSELLEVLLPYYDREIDQEVLREIRELAKHMPDRAHFVRGISDKLGAEIVKFQRRKDSKPVAHMA
jgi:chorismate mutase